MEIIAFTADHVCRLTGLSPRQLGYWDKTGFFSPTLIDPYRRRAFGRIYDFRDVVGLRAISILRNVHHIPLQELRKVGEWLRARHDSPWSKLRFALSGRRVSFFDPVARRYVEARGAGQVILGIELEPIANEMQKAAARLRDRKREDVGQIVRNRFVVHNAWVIAGTRIPTKAIWNLHEAGYSASRIIKEYPRLKRSDVQAALKHHTESLRAA